MSHRFLFYIDSADISGDKVRFNRSESHHMRGVLRLEQRTQVEATDGLGYIYRIQLAESAGGHQFGKILEKYLEEPRAPLPILIAVPCLKGGRWEIAVEAACEMGVEAIYPVDFLRAVLKWIPSRIEKIKRKAVEIMKQSGGSRLTEIKEPRALQPLIEQECFAEIWLADPGGGFLSEVRKGTLLIVGPEAGLDEKEEEYLTEVNVQRFNLGSRRMRSEMAAVVSLAQVQYCLMMK